MDKSTKVIESKEISKVFGNFTAVNRISFDVFRGEIFGFLGANGAGKTTAIKIFTGLHAPSSGQALVAGYDIYKQSEKIKKNIGYMSQKFSLYEELTVIENMQFYGGIYGMRPKEIKSKSGELLERLGMEEHARALVGSLPLGWKQKIAFSTAILHKPQIVFLDEPTGGVDPITRRQFWELIYAAADSGTTVFVTTHYMDEAEYCDRISMMVDGEIRALDTPSGLKKTFASDSMDEVFIKIARGENYQRS